MQQESLQRLSGTTSAILLGGMAALSVVFVAESITNSPAEFEAAVDCYDTNAGVDRQLCLNNVADEYGALSTTTIFELGTVAGLGVFAYRRHSETSANA